MTVSSNDRTLRHSEDIVLDDAHERGGRYSVLVMWRLTKYIWPHRLKLILTLAVMLVNIGTVVAIPWMVKLVIDNYIAGDADSPSGLETTILAFGAVVLLHYAMDYLYWRNVVVLSQEVLYTLRIELIRHLLRLSMGFYDRNQVGRVMSRAQNDIQQLQELFNVTVFSLVNVVGLVGVTIAMLAMDIQLALITLSASVLIFPVLILWQKYAQVSFVRAREAIADVNSKLQENLSGIRVVQSLNRQTANTQLFADANSKNLSASLRAHRFSNARN